MARRVLLTLAERRSCSLPGSMSLQPDSAVSDLIEHRDGSWNALSRIKVFFCESSGKIAQENDGFYLFTRDC